MKRLKMESATVGMMIDLYCRKHHRDVKNSNTGLCPKCAELHDYAAIRIEGCRYGEDKPVCRRCDTHC